MIGGVVAVGLLAGAIAIDRSRTGAEDVQVVFGEQDGLPEDLNEGQNYDAAFVIGWSGPVTMRDGLVSVFASATVTAPRTLPTTAGRSSVTRRSTTSSARSGRRARSPRPAPASTHSCSRSRTPPAT